VGAAVAVSDDGAIAYVTAPLPTGPGGTTQTNAIRIDTASGTHVVIPRVCPTAGTTGCPAADTLSVVAARGASADGNVAVGSSVGPGLQRRAFRYVHGSGTTPIPLLPGGSFNSALAVSPDGDKVLVAGNADGVLGNAVGTLTDQVYIYTASTNSIERLGSPNSYWGPGGRLCLNNTCSLSAISGGPNTAPGGMTADGAVVAMNFGGQNIPGESSAYIHNQYGWFHFKSVLVASGVDFEADGWRGETMFLIYGISPDGTLVFGAGVHGGVVKGFVAEFAPGALASFHSTPAPPADLAFVGAWVICLTTCDPNNPADVGVFTADGAYLHINAKGFERGHYTYDGHQLNVTTLTDTNGSDGLSDDNGTSIEITVAGNIATIVDNGTPMVAAHRIVGGASSVLGGWTNGTPTVGDMFAAVLAGGATIFVAQDRPFNKGSDAGEYTFDAGSQQVTVQFPGDPVAVPQPAVLSPDERQLLVDVDDDGNLNVLTRVIDPRTPAITSALTATATTSLPFAYQVSATHGPTSFGLLGTLPAGLNFDAATGLIAGTPTQTGAFDVRIEASNTLSTVAGVNRLSLTVIAPVQITGVGPATVTPIPPKPGEAPPITIEFTNITSVGQISVATIDPETVTTAPDPPAGFSLGDDPVYYEITPSPGLAFDGPVQVCFSYAGVTFSGFPRLLHYDVALASWVDITLQPVDTVNQIVCGLTSSFSPFAIATTALRPVGFHQPVEPVAGALNTAKGGSTVPLKFNVYDAAGAEITSPSGIGNPKFLMSRFACDTGELEDEVPATATGGTALRYDPTARQFIQNWKTPKTPGACYLVKVTGDGLLINARFKLK
jgi:hypothetical protein